MPKKLEDHLRNEVETNPKYKHLSKERKNALIYGVMRKTGWVPKGQKAEAWDFGGVQDDSALGEELLTHVYKQVK